MNDFNRFGSHVLPFLRHYLAEWDFYKPAWNYEDGCIFEGCLDLGDATGRSEFSDFVLDKVGPRVLEDGTITGFDIGEYNIDNVKSGKIFFPLYERTGEERFRRAIATQMAQLRTHPRTKSGNYWHKNIYPWQVWLDGLYMAQPLVTAQAVATGDRAAWEDVVNQFLSVRDHLRDARTGLYYHGWDESRQERWADPRTGCSPNFWGRAMGWFMMALADCIELSAPFDGPARAALIGLFQDTARALMAVRSPRGLWWQVLDRGGDAGNYEESSASLMIAYALMAGVRLGVLPADQGQAGEVALRTVIDGYLSHTELGGICGVAGLGNTPYRDGSYEYYLSERLIPNDPKGVGALMMALSEGVRRP
ncbi:glycoside hydrolase family 88/105 protein [Niveispirillum fermenti]|uniref:glycoside hydrolase family 88/105 protein n=1 Tax=Niveispirillum fermenti TaxID=1233113 RepID=UPI003A85E188